VLLWDYYTTLRGCLQEHISLSAQEQAFPTPIALTLAQLFDLSFTCFTMSMPEYQRHTMIQNTLRASAETLHIPEVARQLGAYTAALLRVQSHIETPPIINGVVALDGYRSKAIPAVALHIGERVLRRPQDLLFDARQRYEINKEYKSGLARDIFAAFADHYSDTPAPEGEISFDHKNIAAFVDADIVEPEKDSWQVYMRGRPIMAFNLDAEQPCTTVDTIHEQTHLVQVLREPISAIPFYRFDNCLSRELEAYHVEAQVLRGCVAAGRIDDLVTNDVEYDNAKQALEIDAIRMHHHIAGAPLFAPSQQLIDDLHANNLYITITDFYANEKN
jgi:hypothetical protein